MLQLSASTNNDTCFCWPDWLPDHFCWVLHSICFEHWMWRHVIHFVGHRTDEMPQNSLHTCEEATDMDTNVQRIWVTAVTVTCINSIGIGWTISLIVIQSHHLWGRQEDKWIRHVHQKEIYRSKHTRPAWHLDWNLKNFIKCEWCGPHRQQLSTRIDFMWAAAQLGGQSELDGSSKEKITRKEDGSCRPKLLVICLTVPTAPVPYQKHNLPE